MKNPLNNNQNLKYEFLLNMIKEAGLIANRYFENIANLTVETKSAQNLVSEADKNVEKFIANKIMEKFPKDNIWGEEFSSYKNYDHQQGTWVIDPIDGTLPFLSGLPSWCISVGYAYDNQIIFGAVYDPNLDELFHAFKNQGSYLNNKKLLVDESKSLTKGLIGVGFSLRLRLEDVKATIQKLHEAQAMLYCSGSGTQMICFAAAGRLNGYCESHLNSWDACAGLIICSEAGLKTNNFTTSGWLEKGNSILVAPPKIFEQISKMIPWDI